MQFWGAFFNLKNIFIYSLHSILAIRLDFYCLWLLTNKAQASQSVTGKEPSKVTPLAMCHGDVEHAYPCTNTCM